MPENTVRIKATLDDKVSTGLDRIRDRFDTLGKTKGFQSIITGVGVGIGAAIWQEATTNIVGAIGGVIKAGLEEEASIAKLGTTLKANVPNWDGNTAAIEKVILAQTNLGFSDSEQRDSLGALAAATHDVGKAQRAQAVAMDLARFKGISLADASQALVKVEAGRYRVLASLGIQLKKGATQEEALAAVQKLAFGQAADYANTTAGKLLVAQTKANDAMERLGVAILPVVAVAAEGAAGAIDTITNALDGMDNRHVALGDLPWPLGPKGEPDWNKTVADLIGGLDPAFKFINDQTGATFTASAAAAKTFADKVTGDFGRIGSDAPIQMGKVNTALDGMDSASRDSTVAFRIWMGKINKTFDGVATKAIADAQAMIDGYFNPLEERWALHQTRVQLAADKIALAQAKTKEASRTARAAIVADLDAEGTHLVTLAAAHALSKKDVDNYVKDVKAAYGKVPPAIQAIVNKMYGLAGVNVTVNVATKGYGGHAPGRGPLMADGGPIPGPKGAPFPIVAHGGEYVVPAHGALVSGGGSGGGSASHTIILQVDGRELAAIVDKHNATTLQRAVPTQLRV